MSYTVTHEPPYIWFEIDRPRALNAVDFDVMEGLEDALTRAEKDPDIRAFVLIGAGRRAFISGGDLRKFASLRTREQVGMMALRMKVVLDRLEALDAWTIAAVNAPAFGGGTETALACDFRIMADDASFGFTQVNFAVPPGWGGLTRLAETVGTPLALRWLAQAAVIEAEEALTRGLVHQTAPFADLRATVRAFCSRMVQHDRVLIHALKSGMRNAHQLPRKEAIAAELGPFVDCWLDDEHDRRIAGFLDRTR